MGYILYLLGVHSKRHQKAEPSNFLREKEMTVAVLR